MFLLAFLPILIIFGIIGYLVFMGAFLPIPIEEKTVGPFSFLYKEINVKDHSLVGKTTTEIAELLKQYNFSNPRPFQFFYPEEDKRFAEIGFIVEENASSMDGLKFKTIPATLCLTTSFPWRNSLSFVFGFMKVDPILKQYRESNNYKKTEAMVTLDAGTIHYMQRVEKYG
jgi:hypothetical protein